MNWFVYALICVFGWGCADLFYKKGTDETDKYSQYKIAVWVGLVMGIVSLFLLPFAETTFSLGSFFGNATKYLPASLGYIISMVIGYAGLRYLEVSVISPVQNSSGALSAIAMTAIFLILGKEIDYTAIDYIGTGVIVSGVVALAIVEQRLSLNERSLEVKEEDKKYRFGALALIFPVLYCVFDTIGTAADGIILDDEVGLGLGDIDVLVIYGLTFMFAGLVCWIIMFAKTKKPYNPFKRSETPKGAAALAEAGFAVRETEVVAVTVPDRPGGMAELTAKLDRAGVDIEYSYAYSLGHADKAVLVFKFADNAKAEAALCVSLSPEPKASR